MFFGDNTIEPDDGEDERFFSLAAIVDEVHVEWDSDEKKTMLLIQQNGASFLFFKTRRDWQGDGPQVKNRGDGVVGEGCYVVFAPAEWRRIGKAPIESPFTPYDDDGICAAVASIPCLEIFLAQPQEYREKTIPPTVPLLAMEAAAATSWHQLRPAKAAFATAALTGFGVSARPPTNTSA